MWPMSVNWCPGTFDPPNVIVMIMKVEHVITSSFVNIIHDIFWEFNIPLSINDFPHSLQICLCLLLSQYRNGFESHMRKSVNTQFKTEVDKKKKSSLKVYPNPPRLELWVVCSRGSSVMSEWQALDSSIRKTDGGGVEKWLCNKCNIVWMQEAAGPVHSLSAWLELKPSVLASERPADGR